MKKLFLSAILSLVVVAGMNAQAYKWWVGGRTSFWTGDGVTTISLAPEVGYIFSPKITFAAALGFQTEKYDYSKDWYNGMVFNPYVRYVAFKQGIVLGFVDSGIDVGAGDLEGFQIGFKPGIAVLLSERFTAATQFGFIGYNDGKKIGRGQKGFGFDLSGYCPIIAFFYSF